MTEGRWFPWKEQEMDIRPHPGECLAVKAFGKTLRMAAFLRFKTTADYSRFPACRIQRQVQALLDRATFVVKKCA